MQAYFPHPYDPEAKIYVFVNACHVMKLVRNTMSEWYVLKGKDDKEIKWQYFIELEKLQEAEGLRLANKLHLVHINWKPQKKKVNLAGQSVANALEFCEGKQKLPQFQGCGPTVKFICVFDRLFDNLNSRNPLTRNFKAPIRKSNYAYTKSKLDEAGKYIRKLQCSHSKPIVTFKRKTGLFGFFICIDSVLSLSLDLVVLEKPVLKYLLTYKMSQNHLDIFFRP